MKYSASKEGGLQVHRDTADVAANRAAARDPEILNDPVTGLRREAFLPLFEPGGGSRTLRHPVADELNALYNPPLTAYLKDEAGSRRDALGEANRLAQQRIDEYFAAHPGAG